MLRSVYLKNKKKLAENENYKHDTSTQTLCEYLINMVLHVSNCYEDRDGKPWRFTRASLEGGTALQGKAGISSPLLK